LSGNLAWIKHYIVMATVLPVPQTTPQQSSLGFSTWYYFMTCVSYMSVSHVA